jgi:hypothetical protein
MSIMDIFRGGQQPAAKPGELAAPTQTGSPTNPNAPQITPAGIADANAAAADANASPMAGFEKLWQNDDTNKGAAPVPLFDIDPAKLNEAVKTADFTRQLPPEIIQKALSGDKEAFVAAMNGVAQQAFSHQTMATTKLIEQALDKRDAELGNKIPDLVRNANISENLADSPLFQNEATRPLMESLQAQLAIKYPKATSAQIAEQARSYIANFAKLATGNPAADAKQTAADKADDWSGF